MTTTMFNVHAWGESTSSPLQNTGGDIAKEIRELTDTLDDTDCLNRITTTYSAAVNTFGLKKTSPRKKSKNTAWFNRTCKSVREQNDLSKKIFGLSKDQPEKQVSITVKVLRRHII